MPLTKPWQLSISGSIPTCPGHWDTSWDWKNANWSGDSPFLLKTRNSISIPLALFWLSLFCVSKSWEQAWAAPGTGPAHSPCVTLAAWLGRFCEGHMGLCDPQPFLRPEHHHKLPSAPSSPSPATNQQQRGLVSTSNTTRTAQRSHKALRGSGNSFLHFTKNASLGIDKIRKDGWQAAQK